MNLAGILCLPSSLNSTFIIEILKVTWGKKLIVVAVQGWQAPAGRSTLICALFFFSLFLSETLTQENYWVLWATLQHTALPFFVPVLIKLRNKPKMIVEGNPFSLLWRKANLEDRVRCKYIKNLMPGPQNLANFISNCRLWTQNRNCTL